MQEQRPDALPAGTLAGWRGSGRLRERWNLTASFSTIALRRRVTVTGWHSGVRRVARGGEIFAEVALAGENASEAQGFWIHPALSDASLHAALLEVPTGIRGEGSVLLC